MIYREIPFQLAFVNQKSVTDLYVRIGNDYRLFAAKGAILPEEQLHQFQEAKTKIYLMANDAAEADESMEEHLVNILVSPEVSPQVKAVIAYTTSMKSIQEVFHVTNMKTITEVKKLSKKIVKMILSDTMIMEDFIKISSSDHYTLKHSVKVGVYGTAMTVNLYQDRIKDHNLEELAMAFFLHDIGMTKVPSNILDKQEPLTDGDWETIKKHPLWGHEKLKKANYESHEMDIITMYHHERCNGSGYPFGRTGDEIPVYAKICAIADTFESLTAGRPFKRAKTPFEALKIMQVEMANEFDPDLFRAFIMLLGSRK